MCLLYHFVELQSGFTDMEGSTDFEIDAWGGEHTIRNVTVGSHYVVHLKLI